MSCRKQSEYIKMISSTANINSTLDKISSAIAAAKRAGIQISTAFQGDFFCCVSLKENINRAIDLSEQKASLKLNALLEHIYTITPSDTAMNNNSSTSGFDVTFIPRSSKNFAIEYSVKADNQAKAEEIAVTQLCEEGFSRSNYKSKAQVRSAA